MSNYVKNKYLKNLYLKIKLILKVKIQFNEILLFLLLFS